MADEVKKESKDQRRSRLNREGKEFLKNGQTHLITPQHQTAMDYMSRKRKADNSVRPERRKAETNLGEGSPIARATGADTVKSAGTAALPISNEQHDKVFKKLAKAINERGQEFPGTKYEGIANTVAPKKRLNKIGAINEDNTHHAAMATFADHLSDKLEEADYHGILHSKDSADIDKALYQSYKSLHESNTAHDSGQVNDAKVHMESAHRNLYSAATQMAKKGVELHPGLIGALKTTAEGYIKSTRPGEGAMPHPGFRPPKGRSATVRMESEEDEKKSLEGALAKKVSGKPIRSAEDTSWTEDESDGVNNNDTPGLIGRQLESYLPVKSPKYVKGN